MRTEMIPPIIVRLTKEVEGYAKGSEGVMLMTLSCPDREEVVVRMDENGWAVYLAADCVEVVE